MTFPDQWSDKRTIRGGVRTPLHVANSLLGRRVIGSSASSSREMIGLPFMAILIAANETL
ncbi:hypothetical protein [Microvirga yunnanensis]|uniref:hypothetical protein n=1 Tax=Microvirga yunnanensis TaxID=2953740 RepID=UPI0021C5F8D9|nr:hypothetical protein [Microvirga sp. HBU65207]